MSKSETIRTEKDEENEQRAERLRDELARVYGSSLSAEKLGKKLGIPKGTASGLLYKGASPSNRKAIAIADTLGIDVVFWIMGLRLNIDPDRLADSMAFVENIMAKKEKTDFTLDQVATMISMVYNSREMVCETVIETMANLLQQQSKTKENTKAN